MRISDRGNGASPEDTDLASATIDAVGSAICVVDQEGRVMRWNPAASALTGISLPQIQGRLFQEFVLFPGDLENWKRGSEAIFAGSATRRFQTRWRNRDGGFSDLNCFCSGIRDAAGRVTRMVCNAAGNAAVLDALSTELMADRAEEFLDISRFLHKTVAQSLVALSFEAGKLEGILMPGLAQAVGDLIDRCCRDIRMVSYMLAPVLLPGCTLEDSIRYFTNCLCEEAGLDITVDFDAVPVNLPREGQLLLSAAIQEWANRWIRNRPEAKLAIGLGNDGLAIVLELEMVLTGPTAPSPADWLLGGWTLIRERARALGGKFDLTGDSMRYFARISLPEPAKP